MAMDPKKKATLIIAFGKKKPAMHEDEEQDKSLISKMMDKKEKDEDEKSDEEIDSDAYKAAAQDAFDAIKEEDIDKFTSALHDFVKACMGE